MKKFLYFIAAAVMAFGISMIPDSAVHAEDFVPIYRVYNPNSGEHLLTRGTGEADMLTKLGWNNEGISWFAPKDGGTPVYRLYFPDKFHLYTSDANEVEYLTSKAGWLADNDGKPAFYSGGTAEIYRLYHPKTTRHLLTSSKKEYDLLASQDWQGEGVGMTGLSVPGATGTPGGTAGGAASGGGSTGGAGGSAGGAVQNPATIPSQTGPVAGTFNPSYVKGVWISFLDWQENLKGKNETDFRSTFAKMCDNVVANGCNTVYVHVRSHNDAVYPSAIYPWSTEMLEGVPAYNPLAIMVDIAHAKGLSFQAWINPYGYRNGQFAGDPLLVTKTNIIAGIKEIVSNYNVDGIHFDDYFPDYDKSVHNELIREAYAMAHSYGKIFGVSPQGNISNNRAKGVDIDTWLSSPGYIDYLAPQIYWTDQYGKDAKTTMFSDRLKAWTDLNKINLPMYVGLATYRTGNSYDSDPGWVLTDNNLATQVAKANAAGWDGYIHFRYANLLEAKAQSELSKLGK